MGNEQDPKAADQPADGSVKDDDKTTDTYVPEDEQE